MKDYIVRATAANGQVRAFAATTRGVVETARKDHNTSPIATVALGRLLTGAAMMGIMMKNDSGGYASIKEWTYGYSRCSWYRCFKCN